MSVKRSQLSIKEDDEVELSRSPVQKSRSNLSQQVSDPKTLFFAMPCSDVSDDSSSEDDSSSVLDRVERSASHSFSDASVPASIFRKFNIKDDNYCRLVDAARMIQKELRRQTEEEKGQDLPKKFV